VETFQDDDAGYRAWLYANMGSEPPTMFLSGSLFRA
jgi:hypothetical protein